jgi:uncharacterized protein (UPF0261 family)
MQSQVLLISTLDTKAAEAFYLKEQMEKGGLEVWVMDLSMGAASPHTCRVPARQVALAGGWDIESIRKSKERAKITATMTKGATKIAREMFFQGRLRAVVGLGGSTGSLMAGEVMHGLPFGLGKLLVSSTAALPGMATRYIGTADLMLLHTVVEIAGLTPLLRSVLDRAAETAVGLAKAPLPDPGKNMQNGERLLAMSMFGPCEKCAQRARQGLEEAGWQVIGYSAAGVCDRAMEKMIGQGYFKGVLDIASGGVGEEIMGGMRAAGPERLETAGRMGLPQVIAPSGVNLMSPRKSRYKPDYYQRRKYDLDKHRTFLRLNPDELVKVAEEFARKLNQARGPVIFLIPTRGWASFDCQGQSVYAPLEDRIFTGELKKRTKEHVEVREVEANLEEPLFSDELVKAMLFLLKKKPGEVHG